MPNPSQIFQNTAFLHHSQEMVGHLCVFASALSKERVSARDISSDKTDSPPNNLIHLESCCEWTASAGSSESLSNISPSDRFCDSAERNTQCMQLQCKVMGAYSILCPAGDSFESWQAALDDEWLVFTKHQVGTAGFREQLVKSFGLSSAGIFISIAADRGAAGYNIAVPFLHTPHQVHSNPPTQRVIPWLCAEQRCLEAEGRASPAAAAAACSHTGAACSSALPAWSSH